MEGRRTLEHLSVEENLQVGAYRRKDRAGVKRDLEMVYDYFPRIREYRKRTSGYLSGGEQQMMVIGRALMADSAASCCWTSPPSGLAPLAVQEIYEIIKKINEDRGVSMLIVEQNVKAALGIADYGYVMENGQHRSQRAGRQAQDNEDVKEFYMGISSSGSQKNYREIKHYRRRKRWLSWSTPASAALDTWPKVLEQQQPPASARAARPCATSTTASGSRTAGRTTCTTSSTWRSGCCRSASSRGANC